LVGPACASDEAGSKWLAEFMHLVASDPPDYIGVHYYGTDADAAIKYLEAVHEKYPSKPLVVSEIASISRDKKEVYAFTAEVANWMDDRPWIFEYGFF
ncbi:hypothetical protein BDY21DRAFT_261648, partial [Lineolata rhizophorae]